MRGSSFILKSRAAGRPAPRWRSATRASASMTIVRNLKHANSVPSRPTRVCRNRTGPRSCAQTRSGGEREHRREGQDQEARAHDVEGALGPAGRRAATRGGSRCTSGSPPTGRMRTRSLDDVGDARGDDDLDVVLLEVPHGLAHLRGRLEGAAGDEDGVGVQGVGHPGDVVGVAPDLDPRGGHLAEVGGRRDGPHDVVAQPGLAAQDGGDLVDVGRQCRPGRRGGAARRGAGRS